MFDLFILPDAQAANPEALQQLALLDRPWYEALSLTHDQATAIVGEDAAEYTVGNGSRLARRVAEFALSSADVDVLKPVQVWRSRRYFMLPRAQPPTVKLSFTCSAKVF